MEQMLCLIDEANDEIEEKEHRLYTPNMSNLAKLEHI